MAEVTYEGEERDSDGLGPIGQRIQAPPTLLPRVLDQLGLTLEAHAVEVPSEIVVDDLIEDLQNDNWQMRIAAVRRLGKLGERAPVSLLEAALDDEDSSVRAAVVQVLGCMGKRAPLPRLVAALHDADWHVREVAVCVLGSWKQDIPGTELTSALYDVDASVRQAARLVLHDDISSVKYGRLWEQNSMQQRQEPSLQNEGEHNDPFTLNQNGAGTGAGQSEYAYVLHEQSQAYDPSGPSSYEHTTPVSERWEKVTDLPPRRSQKGWWGIVAVTAVMFFLLGGGVTSVMMPRMSAIPGMMKGGSIGPYNPNRNVGNFSLIIQKEVSGALNMTPDSIRGQLREGKHLSDIATAQGISEDQLQKVEAQALADATNSMLPPDNGHVVVVGPNGAADPASGSQAPRGNLSFNGNPQMMDRLVTQAFLTTK